MPVKSESVRVGELLRFEANSLYCRESKTILDGQVFTVGKPAKLNAAGKAVVLDAAAANEVQTIVFGAAATAGTVKLGVTIGGVVTWTDAIAWNTTDATFLAAINTGLADIAGGVSLIVATARPSIDTDLGFVITFSGAGYAGLPQALIEVDASALTSVTSTAVTRTTAGHTVGGDMSMICLEDKSPVGADVAAAFLVRGPAIVDIDQVLFPVGGKPAAIAALAAFNPPVLGKSEPSKFTEV